MTLLRSISSITLLALLGGFTLPAAAQDTLRIDGEITEARTGKPLPGIHVAYGPAAALTDDKGHFVLGVPGTAVTITVSGAGYQQKEIALKGRSHVTTALYEAAFSSLYSNTWLPAGNRPLHKTVGAIAAVHTAGAWQAGTETPDAYLQGKVAGLTATRRSGTPGTGAELLLRGFSSLHATNQPLIVVDGVIYDNNHYGSSLIGGHLTNPLQDIDVKDIDQVTVIKDAVTTYGTKAANGVLLITTSRARELATRIDFAAYEGVNRVPQQLPVMQAGDYRIYLSDLLASGGYSDAQIQALPYMNDNKTASQYYQYHNNTNWQKDVLRAGRSSNYYLKVTGGDDIARYALSMGYGKNTGITGETNLTSYRTRFNADLNLTKKLTANANLSFTYNEQQLKDQGLSPLTNPLYVALVKAPFLAVNELNAEGLKSPNLAETDLFNISNPQALISNAQAADKNYRFFGLINANYAFNKRFSLASTIGLTYDKIRENTFIPRKGVANDTLSNAIADSRLGSRVQRLFSVYNDTRFAYTEVLNRIHTIHATVGFRYQQSNTEQDYALGYNSATDNLISVGKGANALRVVGGDIGKSKWVNSYATVDYQLSDKYFATASISADGSSRFGSTISGAPAIGGNKLAILPALGVGWLLSSEQFMAGVPFIELLKLRASYGLTGNDDIGNYDARRYYVSQNLLGLEGLVRGNIGNPALQWERVKKANIGIDAAFLKERLSVSIDAWQHTTAHLLIYEPVNAAAGFDFIKTNNAAMKTTGLDLRLGSRILNGAVTWDASVLVSKYRNNITQLPAGAPLTTGYAGATYLTQEGSAANLFYGFRTQGVYTTDAAATADGYAVATANGTRLPFKGGDIRFEDRNGDKLIDNNDRFVIGNPNPDWTGSISSAVGYKRFTLDVLFTFSQGNDVFNYTRASLESASTTNNQTLRIANRWRGNGQITDVPRASLGDPLGNARFSDRWIEDGSYLRLRTLALTYDIPVKTSFLRYAKVYATANNLLTFTHYLGYDPEFSANSSVFNQGVDTGLEPLYKSVQLGVRVGL